MIIPAARSLKIVSTARSSMVVFMPNLTKRLYSAFDAQLITYVPIFLSQSAIFLIPPAFSIKLFAPGPKNCCLNSNASITLSTMPFAISIETLGNKNPSGAPPKNGEVGPPTTGMSGANTYPVHLFINSLTDIS